MKIKKIALYAVLIALYVGITNLLGGISFGIFQFRVSEILLLLPFYNRRYSVPCIIAVALGNLFSPLGLIDVAVGTIIAAVSYTVIIYISNIYVDTLLYSLLCGLLVGAELHIVLQLDLFLSIFSVFISQIAVCSILGVQVLNLLAKNREVNKLLELRTKQA